MDWSDLTKQDLEKFVSTMSARQIGERYGVSTNAVYNKLNKFGIKKRFGGRKFDPPKDELEFFYLRTSMANIARFYGVGETVVFKRIKEHGFDRVSRSQRLTGRGKKNSHVANMRREAILSGRHQGERNGNWRGGTTSINKRHRSTAEFKAWKEAVRKRAGYRCEDCNAKHDGKDIILHSHHIKPLSEYPELMYDVSNGKALCPPCHYKEHWKTP